MAMVRTQLSPGAAALRAQLDLLVLDGELDVNALCRSRAAGPEFQGDEGNVI